MIFQLSHKNHNNSKKKINNNRIKECSKYSNERTQNKKPPPNKFLPTYNLLQQQKPPLPNNKQSQMIKKTQ
jgi:hypothetical protein